MKKLINIALGIMCILGVISFWISSGMVIYHLIIDGSMPWQVIIMGVSLLPSIIKIFCCGAGTANCMKTRNITAIFAVNRDIPQSPG